jgi:hypothetical protein
MIRQLLCQTCGKDYRLHPEDKAFGWKARAAFVSAVKPTGHGITINGEFHHLPELICDLCGETLTGQIAIAVTMWQGDEPEHWESEYGTVVPAESVKMDNLLKGQTE